MSREASNLSKAHREAIARFLGEEAASGSPFALLGLGVTDLNEDTIRVALAQRLEELDAHHEASTPDADDLRLALHAAASQLMHPDVRALLRKRWGGVQPARPAPAAPTQRTPAPPSPTAPQPGPPPAGAGTGLRDVLAILALEGGINPKSIRHIAAIAQARNLPSASIPQLIRAAIIQAPAQPGVQPAAMPTAGKVQPKAPGAGAPSSRRIEEEKREWLGVSVFGAIVLVTLAVAVVAWNPLRSTLFSSPPQSQADAPRTERVAPGAESLSAEREARTAQAARPVELLNRKGADDPEVVIYALRSALSRMKDDPDSASVGFMASALDARRLWHRMSPSQLELANAHVADSIIASQASNEATFRILATIAAPPVADPGEVTVTQDLWIEATLSGLLADARTRAQTRQAVEELARRRSPPWQLSPEPFIVCVERSLVRAAEEPDAPERRAEYWESWLRAADAALIEQSVAHDRALTAALDALLRAGADPTVAIRFVAERLDWGAGTSAASGLLSWLADPSIASDRLHALTSAIVTSSRTRGIDASMVLAADAGADAREALRLRYAQSDAPVQTKTWEWAEWRTLASLGATRLPESDWHDARLLAECAALARLNYAAALLGRGETSDAGLIISDLRTDIDAILLPVSVPPAAGFGAPDAGREWALRYHRAGASTPVKLSLLDEAESMTEFGPFAAETIVNEAIFASTGEVKRRARDLIVAKSTDPELLAGLLEALPELSPLEPNRAFISSVTGRGLPPARDPAWGASARRAVVEALLFALAGADGSDVFDQLADVLSVSYSGRANGDSSPGAQPLDQSARELFLVNRNRARLADSGVTLGVSVREIDRRRAGRVSISKGVVQRFAAEQISTLEVRAVTAASSEPTRTREIRAILEQTRRARSQAESVFEQLFHVEQAMLRLNVIELSSEDPG